MIEIEQNNATRLSAVSASVYRQECASCHMLYFTGLLHSRPRQAVMANLKDHFGEYVSVDPESTKAIRKYLEKNSAGQSPFLAIPEDRFFNPEK